MAEDIQGKEYGPIGYCIYCGGPGEGDEHIMPYSLGGNSLLLKASCHECEAVTSYLDGYLARATFRNMLVAAGTQSRSGHPKFVAVPFEIGDGMRDVTMSAHEHAFTTHMPVWGLPGILRGAPITDGFPEAKSMMYWYVPPNIRATLGLTSTEDIRLIDKTKMPNINTFARAVAKIAYCHTFARYWQQGFRPLNVPDMILGKNNYAPYFVGAAMDDPEPPDAPNVKHALKNQIANIGARMEVLAVTLRLFANSGTAEHGMPIYHVITGARLVQGATNKRWVREQRTHARSVKILLPYG